MAQYCSAVDILRNHTLSKKQIRPLANGIERFGFNNPVLIDRECGVVAGHCRRVVLRSSMRVLNRRQERISDA